MARKRYIYIFITGTAHSLMISVNIVSYICLSLQSLATDMQRHSHQYTQISENCELVDVNFFIPLFLLDLNAIFEFENFPDGLEEVTRLNIHVQNRSVGSAWRGPFIIYTILPIQCVIENLCNVYDENNVQLQKSAPKPAFTTRLFKYFYVSSQSANINIEWYGYKINVDISYLKKAKYDDLNNK